MRERLLGSDTPRDFGHLLFLFAAFLTADRLTRRFASVSPDGLFSPVLVQQAVAENPTVFVLLLLGFAGVAAVGSPRLLSRWDALEHGSVLRRIAAALLLWLAWRASGYDFNYVLGRWHGVDRILVAALGCAAIWRPVFLVPFVAQVRVIGGQFTYPVGSAFGQVFDELLLLVLLAAGAAYLLHILTGRRSSSAILLIWSTIIAAHLFEPGRAKLMMGWLQSDDVSMLAFNSYTAGWVGQGSGEYAQRLGGLIAAIGWPVKVGTLAIELGALVAVIHPRLFRLWLPMAAIFHGLTFAMTGFFFFDWLALELSLCVVLCLPSLRLWVESNATPARALFATAVVAFGANFYHAPSLAWLDAPVGYGYEVEATGRSGQEYHVPLSAFAPFEQEMTFTQVKLSPTRHAVGGYGATGSAATATSLGRLNDIDGLASIEAGLAPVSSYPDSLSERLMVDFFRRVSSETVGPTNILSPPSRFWSGRPEPSYRSDEPLDRLMVTLVASLTVGGKQQFRRTPVLSISRGPDGEPVLDRLATNPSR